MYAPISVGHLHPSRLLDQRAAAISKGPQHARGVARVPRWHLEDARLPADHRRWNIIRALVKRVEVEKGQVNVVFRVDQLPFDSRPKRGVLQHCWWRNSATLGTRRWALAATPMMQHSNLAGDCEIESHLHRGRNPESRCIV